MTKAWVYLTSRLTCETGSTMVEYSLVVVLIGVLSVLVVGALGIDVFGQFDGAQGNFTNAVPGGPTP